MGRKSRAKKEFRAEVQIELSRRPTRWENVTWGLGWGIGMAALFSLFVIVQSLVRGSFYYERAGISGWKLVGGYAVAGIAAGLLVGTLRRMTSRRSNAVLLGIFIGVVVYGIVGTVTFGLHWDVFVSALVAGPVIGGLVAWRWSDPETGLSQTEHALCAGAIMRVTERRNAARRQSR